MAKMTYREQLMHPNWQRKRLEVMEAAQFSCENCGDDEKTLNVHHRRYVKGRMAWEYEGAELQCLCQPCHEQQHNHRELLERLLMQPGMTDGLAIGLIGGYLDAALDLGPELHGECVRVAGEDIICGAVAEMMRPNLKVQWGHIAQAIEGLYVGSSFNPAEESALDLMRMFSGGAAPFVPSKEYDGNA